MKKTRELINSVILELSNWINEKDQSLVNVNTPYQKIYEEEQPLPIEFNLYSKVVFNTHTNIRVLEETKRIIAKDDIDVVYYIKDCLDFAKLQTSQGMRTEPGTYIPWSPRYIKVPGYARTKIIRFYPNELFNLLKLFERLHPNNKRVKDHLNMYFNKHEEIL